MQRSLEGAVKPVSSAPLPLCANDYVGSVLPDSMLFLDRLAVGFYCHTGTCGSAAETICL